MKFIMVFLLALTAMSCVKKSESKITSGGQTWSQRTYAACIDNSGSSSYVIYALRSDGSLTQVNADYTATGCLGEDIESEETFYGTYSYNPDNGDFTGNYQRLFFAFRSAAAVAAGNAEAGGGYCGFSNWVKDVEKEITDNETCQDGTFSAITITSRFVIFNDDRLIIDGNELLRIN